MTRRASLVLLLSVFPVPLAAQASALCANGVTPRGDLGIREVACRGTSCALIIDDSRGRYAEFSTVPTVRALASEARVGSRLRVGDTLLALDGYPLTTSRGAQLLAFPPIEGKVRVLVRRDGADVSQTIDVGASCDPRSPAVFVFGGRGTEQPWRLPLEATGAPNARPNARVSTRVAPGAAQAGAQPAPRPVPRPSPNAAPRPAIAATVTLGMEMACEACGWVQERGGRWEWQSTTAPKVVSITPGGPAERAGILVGDLILSFDGALLTTSAAGEVLRKSRVGVPVRVVVSRDGVRREMSLVPASLR